MPTKHDEKWVKSQVMKLINIYAKYTAVYTLCPMTFGFGESGHPDIILLVNGHFLGIECKKDRNNHHFRPELKAKPNEVAQKRQCEKIRKAGGRWMCVYDGNLNDLAKLLFELSDTKYTEWTDEDYKKLQKIIGV